jgi:hypothetical protein
LRLPLTSPLALRTSAREDIDGCRREQHRGDHDVNPLARHAQQVCQLAQAEHKSRQSKRWRQ